MSEQRKPYDPARIVQKWEDARKADMRFLRTGLSILARSPIDNGYWPDKRRAVRASYARLWLVEHGGIAWN